MKQPKDDAVDSSKKLLARLTEALTLITRAGPLEQVLQAITDQARELVGAHQSVLSLTGSDDWTRSLTSVSLSDKYSVRSNYRVPLEGSAIHSLVCRENRTLRLTQDELEARPAKEGLDHTAERDHVPIRGWLAVPLIDDDGKNLGLIQLSDKYLGEFTEQDEFVTKQLSFFAAVSIQNARLEKSASEAQDRAAEKGAQLLKTMKDLERQRSELELSKEQLELVLSAVDVGFWYNELPLGKLVWNRQVKRHFGLASDVEVDIDDFYRYLHPDDRERIRDEVERSVSTETPFDAEYRTCGPDGVNRWIRAIGQVLDTEPKRFGGITLDISKAKRTQEALVEALEKLHLAVEAADIATWTLESRSPQAIRDALEDLGTLDDQDLNEISCLLDDAEQQDGRLELSIQPTLNQERRWLSLAGQILPTGTVVGVALDVTLQRRTEEALRKARDEALRANQLKSEFLANVSHEIRTPLVGLLGMVEFLQDTPLQPNQKEFTDTLQDCAVTLKTLVDDVLALSHIEAGRLELSPRPCNLPLLLKRCRDLFLSRAHEKGLEFVLRLQEGLPVGIRADRGRLLQVLSNLITNALKFTSSGRILLTASVPTSGRVRLAVSDTGIGIPPESIEHLFQPFVQVDSSASRTYGGTGLGLSIVRRLMELMGGEAWVESRLGEGSTFYVDFPVEETDEVENEIRNDYQDSGWNSHRKVLVAEDNPINRRVITMQLQKLGCEVITAEDGGQAVARLMEHPVALVFMDCQMPGIDGYEATRRIRALDPPLCHTPVVALTAHALAGEKEKCLACGMDDYITKPLSVARVIQVLRTHLGSTKE